MRPTGLENPYPSGVSNPRNGLVAESVADMEDSDTTINLRADVFVVDEEAKLGRLLVERDDGAKPKAMAALWSLLFKVTDRAAAERRVALRVMVMIRDLLVASVPCRVPAMIPPIYLPTSLERGDGVMDAVDLPGFGGGTPRDDDIARNACVFRKAIVCGAERRTLAHAADRRCRLSTSDGDEGRKRGCRIGWCTPTSFKLKSSLIVSSSASALRVLLPTAITVHLIELSPLLVGYSHADQRKRQINNKK